MHYSPSHAKKPAPQSSKAKEAETTIELKGEDENEEADEPYFENTVFISECSIYYILLASHCFTIPFSFISVQDRLKPVEVGKFSDHVQHMHADRDKWFELEYNVSPCMHVKQPGIRIWSCCIS